MEKINKQGMASNNSINTSQGQSRGRGNSFKNRENISSNTIEQVSRSNFANNKQASMDSHPPLDIHIPPPRRGSIKQADTNSNANARPNSEGKFSNSVISATASQQQSSSKRSKDSL